MKAELIWFMKEILPESERVTRDTQRSNQVTGVEVPYLKFSRIVMCNDYTGQIFI